MRGPKPTPTALKVIRGNPGKRALPENEPTPQLGAAAPNCLAHLAAPDAKHYASWHFGVLS